MRIVAGRFRGRALHGPRSGAIRPTSDKLRESLFNILAHSNGDPLPGARVIDLFAGTGAFGLEALSRGAEFCLFVDDGAQARALIRENVDALGLGGVTKIFRRDARRLGEAPSGPKFTIAFLDPPYGKGFARPTLQALDEGFWLAPGALVIVEEAATAEIPTPPVFHQLERRDYGETQVVFLRYAPDDKA